MKRMVLLCIALLFFVLPAHVGAVETRSGDQITVDAPVDDDLFAAGNTITINACIHGDLIALGGIITVNAPIRGDLLVSGGQVRVNDTVEGKIIAAGGIIELRSTAENVIIVGGATTIYSTAVIQRYAFVAGGAFDNAGEIKGDLFVSAEEFENTGTVRGSIEREERAPMLAEGLRNLGLVLSILWKLGVFVLGLVFIKWFGALFFRIEKEVRESTLKKTVLGFICIIAAAIIIVLLAIIVIGLPFAALLMMFLVIVLMVAGLFVSYTVGDWIFNKLKVNTSDMVAFTLGFIILNLLFLIPYAGFVIRVVVCSLGFGAIFYAVKNNWETITAPKA
jgi:hypothetical protein